MKKRRGEIHLYLATVSRYHSYLNSAVTILAAYKGEEPLSSFLKKYFAQHKKFGSKDRKQVSHLCYCYFRLGKALLGLPVEERILTAAFLCSTEPLDIIGELKPGWNQQITLSIEQKLAFISPSFSIDTLFPWTDQLSDETDKQQFILSHFQQPDLFLRIRPGKKKVTLSKLAANHIPFVERGENSIAVANSVKIDELLLIDKEVVIQDLSSQKAGEFLQLVKPATHEGKLSVWDCCAASGGKSIMTNDILGDIDLTVSDIRESILVNLRKRFAAAGLNHYGNFVADLSGPVKELAGRKFDLIIADVPCSGSGTWGRTPEQLYYFEENKIADYARLQKKILGTIHSYLKPGGHLLYITCSVFKKENEEAVRFIKEELELSLVKMELIKGYDKKADTLFAALFQKQLTSE